MSSLIVVALKNNPDLAAGQAQVESTRHRIPQSKTLPDPMVSAGHTNEGLSQYSFGNSYDSVWAFGVSQTVPFPGELVQKGKVAEKEMETQGLQFHALRLATVARVKELYYDLFTAHRTIDILQEKAKLLDQVEKCALAWYASGMGIIALAGLDPEPGVVMLLYLPLAHSQWQDEGRLKTLEDLSEALEHGAVKRIRPKIVIVSVVLAGLLPVIFSTGGSSDIMKRIAAPMIGAWCPPRFWS